MRASAQAMRPDFRVYRLRKTLQTDGSARSDRDDVFPVLDGD